jgi:hypothetical protein
MGRAVDDFPEGFGLLQLPATEIVQPYRSSQAGAGSVAVEEGDGYDDDAALASLFSQMRDEDSVDLDDVLAGDTELQGERLSDSKLQGELHPEQHSATGVPQAEDDKPGASPGSEQDEQQSQLLMQILERYKQQYAEWQQQYAAVAAASDAAGGYQDPTDGAGVYRNADGTVDWDRTGLAVPPGQLLLPHENFQSTAEDVSHVIN